MRGGHTPGATNVSRTRANNLRSRNLRAVNNELPCLRATRVDARVNSVAHGLHLETCTRLNPAPPRRYKCSSSILRTSANTARHANLTPCLLIKSSKRSNFVCTTSMPHTQSQQPRNASHTHSRPCAQPMSSAVRGDIVCASTKGAMTWRHSDAVHSRRPSTFSEPTTHREASWSAVTTAGDRTHLKLIGMTRFVAKKWAAASTLLLDAPTTAMHAPDILYER